MKLNPIGWVEIPALDLDRAKKFYEQLFGYSLKQMNMNGYDMVALPLDYNADGGVSGVLIKGMGYQPSTAGTVIYFNCSDIDATLKNATNMGAKVVLNKKDIGPMGYIAWVEDSEGNYIGLHMGKVKAEKKWLKYVANTLRCVFGILFVFSGIMYFVNPAAVIMQGSVAPADLFMKAMFDTGYFLPLVKVCEIVGGLLLLSKRTVGLGLLLLAPIIANIFLLLAFLMPQMVVVGIVLGAFEIFLAWYYWDKFKSLFR